MQIVKGVLLDKIILLARSTSHSNYLQAFDKIYVLFFFSDSGGEYASVASAPSRVLAHFLDENERIQRHTMNSVSVIPENWYKNRGYRRNLKKLKSLGRKKSKA